MTPIHILNGDCALAEWKKCRFSGDVIVWRENYLQGELLKTDDLMQFNRRRAAELHSFASAATETEIFTELQAMHRALLSLRCDDRLILWFDFCPFDRTMAARILSLLRGMESRPRTQLIFRDVVWNRTAFQEHRSGGVMLADKDFDYGKAQWENYLNGADPGHLLSRWAPAPLNPSE